VAAGVRPAPFLPDLVGRYSAVYAMIGMIAWLFVYRSTATLVQCGILLVFAQAAVEVQGLVSDTCSRTLRLRRSPQIAAMIDLYRGGFSRSRLTGSGSSCSTVPQPAHLRLGDAGLHAARHGGAEIRHYWSARARGTSMSGSRSGAWRGSAHLCAPGLGAAQQQLQPGFGARLEHGGNHSGATRHDRRLCRADHPAVPQGVP
jgi:hypothetical protein